jgi:hypothetical protein
VGHSHDDHRGHYLEQLCTIGMCGALGVVAILMWYRGWLSDLLADTFHPAVLLGGISLLAIVTVRAVALWPAAAPAHDPAHEHGPACDRSHEHSHGPDDGHHHGHEHGWVPVRYVGLLLPVTLFSLGQPNQEFMRRYVKYLSMHELGGRQGLDPGLLADAPGRIVQGIRIARDDEHDRLQVASVGKDSDAEKQGLEPGSAITQITQTTNDDGKPLEKPSVVSTKGLSLKEAVALLKGKPHTKFKLTVEQDGAARDVEITRAEETIALHFKELEGAAYSPAARQFYEGKIGKVTGQFVPISNNVFKLMRLKMTCCGADVIRLDVTIILDPQSGESLAGRFEPTNGVPQWVEVKGQIQFRKRQDRNEYISVLVVPKLEAITPTAEEPFIQ